MANQVWTIQRHRHHWKQDTNKKNKNKKTPKKMGTMHLTNKNGGGEKELLLFIGHPRATHIVI